MMDALEFNPECQCCEPGERCRGFCLKEQIRGSDLYSPTVKRVMERFWLELEKRKAKR